MTKPSIPISIPRPPTATHPLIGLVGLVVMAWLFHLILQHDFPGYQRTLIVVGGMAFAMIATDQLIFKPFARPSTGLNWQKFDFNFGRVVIKLCGLCLTLGLLGFLYFLFPEYKGSFYQPLWDALKLLLPYLIFFSIMYIGIVDAVMVEPKDGYYTFGLLALLQWKMADKTRILPHVRSWLIKGFFIPLMFVYMTNNLMSLTGNLHMNWRENFLSFFNLAWMLIFSTDLVFAVVGYIFAFRALDTHERSSEPTMLGWVVALMCYQPFWSVFERNYIVYDDGLQWTNVFSGSDIGLMLWGSAIIFLIAVYTWATFVFGYRFSNLTHRGIITNGPYRFTKHPAYVTKNLSWWLVSMPFMVHGDLSETIRHCSMLLLLNGVYFMRAWTEERHLMRDPVYRDYQAYIAAHGLFRFLKIRWPKTPAVQ